VPGRRGAMTQLVARASGLARRKPLRAHLGVALLFTALVMLLPASAWARTFQGSISVPAVSADGGTITAQITVSAQCVAPEYCGFFPVVTTVPDAQPCAYVITGSSWVGNLSLYGATNPSVTAVAAWSEWPTLYSGGKRACLYAMSDGTLVAETTYQVPAPPPPPVYATPVYTPPVYTSPVSYVAPQTLGYNEAVRVARSWMSRKYGRRWRQGHGRVVRCPVRTTAAQIGCYAVWVYRSHVYSRTIVITESPTQYTVTGTFYSAPAQPSAPASSTDFCTTYVCIPNYPYGTGTTVQCADGTYSHSGGKQGACSYHGGVARGSAARIGRRYAAQLLVPAQSRLQLTRRTKLLSLSARARR
jgi:hypothetical protein